MKRSMLKSLGVWCLTLMFVAAALGQAVEIKMKDGSKWRGQVSDIVQVRYLQHGVDVPLEGKITKIEPLYIIVEGEVAGVKKQTTIFRSDIVSMTTKQTGSGDLTPQPDDPSSTSPVPSASPANKSKLKDSKLGVFVLPMEGMVGLTYRHEEVEKLGQYIDKNYGPGQTIVLVVDSGGGLASEVVPVWKAIMDLKKKHRVVAWIKSAISAASASAAACDEIYFMTGATMGAMTAFAGDQSLKDEPLRRWMEKAGELFEGGGRHKYVAWAMIEHHQLLSYDKDPNTGEVTWRNDLEGQYILSDAKQNLVFNASNAEHSGFSQGTADTGPQLAKLLNLPEWVEVDDYGRKLAGDWKRLCDEADREITLLGPRLSIRNDIRRQIQLIEDAIKWWNKCPNVCMMKGLPPKDWLERQLAELKKQLADMRR